MSVLDHLMREYYDQPHDVPFGEALRVAVSKLEPWEQLVIKGMIHGDDRRVICDKLDQLRQEGGRTGPDKSIPELFERALRHLKGVLKVAGITPPSPDSRGGRP
jgi:hypothetical protein